MIQSVFSLFQNTQAGLILPNNLFGWLVWLVMAGCLAWGILIR